MVAKKKAAPKKKAVRGNGKKTNGDAMIISKSRVKAAVKQCNVGGDFYTALEGTVRNLIAAAEERAIGNRRKTVRATDV